MIVYRITHNKWAGVLTASGNEARWNADNMYILYTASSVSLACLELLVHIKPISHLNKYSVTTIEIPGNLKIQEVGHGQLPGDWNKKYHPQCRKIGEGWYSKKQSPVLCVPSAIIHQEKNFLINTLHPDFGKLKVLDISKFNFDQRLF